MLNRSGEREQPCLVSDLRGKASSFSTLNMMLVYHFFPKWFKNIYKVVLLSKAEGAFGEVTGRTNDDTGRARVIRDLVC